MSPCHHANIVMPDLAHIPQSPRIQKLALLAVLAVAAATYAPRLNDFFLSDDFHYLRVFSQPASFVVADEWFSVTVGDLNFHFRPVFGLVSWLNYEVFGLEPFWWNAINLLLHLLAVWLTVVLVRRFVLSRWAAIGAGALFAVGFIHAESVLWISARTSLLSTVFVLAAVALETRPRAKRWGLGRWAALVMAVLALLSKEQAVALPLLLLLVPVRPMEFSVMRVPARDRIRDRLGSLCRRIQQQWPYWLLTGGFVALRFGAVMASTQSLVYRLAFGLNVLKNLAFVCVANLFPLDFRAAVAAWSRWQAQQDWAVVSDFLLGYPEVIVGTVAAVVVWLAILLWAHPAARRLAGWMFVAALPVLLFRGSGERLLHLGGGGAAGAIAVLLAAWHRSFCIVFKRIGRFISPIGFIILFILNMMWLNAKLRDWAAAERLARRIVAAMAAQSPALPAGATVAFAGLPDNINGAWVFRLGAADAFTLFANRPDVTAVGTPADTATIVWVWNGDRFAVTAPAAPDARTDPQSAVP
jgi:hypothetical protein